ncbi:Plasmid stabilization system protein ParE [Pseudomonas antarctica]|uniref:Plasmid stabilization system protein n=1 Tax=Pseudomonas antarctica TaxID=219572 RepID=A0A1H0D1V8_9PSED|nr:type II toxin-antitoxin system RelE/ParE family toxin [Pseudomonas antarctica]KAF2406290.1 plasmid stabilization system protein [Pseudomonas antarctica]SDN64153.1 Plasmid stabilization system protein ParE [Pseudomonas antarctica]
MSHSVAFSPEALVQLEALEDCISDTASPRVAARFIDNIISHCESLCVFPLRGSHRDELLPTLRITHYQHTTTIAFMVAADTQTVSILGGYYGGRNYAALLQNDGQPIPPGDG